MVVTDGEVLSFHGAEVLSFHGAVSVRKKYLMVKRHSAVEGSWQEFRGVSVYAQQIGVSTWGKNDMFKRTIWKSI
jgi:hypothetical protein